MNTTDMELTKQQTTVTPNPCESCSWCPTATSDHVGSKR